MFGSRNLAVYLPARPTSPAPRGRAIVVPGRLYRTKAGVGPCSKLATLESAYGDLMKPLRASGKIVAYRVGNLVFGAERPGEVTGVMLARPTDTATLFLLLNHDECVPAGAGSQPEKRLPSGVSRTVV